MAEALSSTTPRPTICCRARVTDFAMTARGEVAGLVQVVRAGMPAQGEDLDAGQRRLGIFKVLAFTLSKPGDRPQHDRGRDRQFHQNRRDAECLAHSPGQDLECLVNAGLGRPALLRDRLERVAQGAGERRLRGFRDHVRDRHRKRLPEQLDRPARQGRQASDVARSLKRDHGLPQGLAVLIREGNFRWRGVAHGRWKRLLRAKFLAHAPYVGIRGPVGQSATLQLSLALVCGGRRSRC